MGGLLGSIEPLFADLLVLIVTSSVFDTQSLPFGYHINFVQSHASISHVIQVLRHTYGTRVTHIRKNACSKPGGRTKSHSAVFC